MGPDPSETYKVNYKVGLQSPEVHFQSEHPSIFACYFTSLYRLFFEFMLHTGESLVEHRLFISYVENHQLLCK